MVWGSYEREAGRKPEDQSLRKQSRSQMKRRLERRGIFLNIRDVTEIHSDRSDVEIRKKKELGIISGFLA